MQYLSPEVKARTEILILGTSPGEKSLKTGKYYQDKKNRMNRVLEAIPSNIREKIGFWDVFNSFESQRASSKDKDRIFGKVNDFQSEIFDKCPKLKKIIFNGKGKRSMKLFCIFDEKYKKEIVSKNIQTFFLSSTSGSNPYFSKEEWINTLNHNT